MKYALLAGDHYCASTHSDCIRGVCDEYGEVVAMLQNSELSRSCSWATIIDSNFKVMADYVYDCKLDRWVKIHR